MEYEKEFTDSIISSTLNNLMKEKSWDNRLITELSHLHKTNSLDDITLLSEVFENNNNKDGGKNND